MNLVHLKAKIYRLSASFALNRLAAFICFGETMQILYPRIGIFSGAAS